MNASPTDTAAALADFVSYEVRTIEFGQATRLEGTTLLVDVPELRELVLADPQLEDVEFAVAHPGEATRIVRVLDVLEPRARISGHGQTFPGIAGAEEESGDGVTGCLTGMALVACGSFDRDGQTFVQEDGIIDMSGIGGELSPFGATANLVVSYRPAQGVDAASASAAIREANVRIARQLATAVAAGTQTATRHRRPTSSERATGGALPRIAYVCALISEGFLHDTMLYGHTTEDLKPRWLEPAAMQDGALVSSDYHYACQRIPTYLYQNNPVVRGLSERDGTELEFVGTVITLRYGTDDEKRQAAQQIVDLCRERSVTGLVVHPAVGGNAQLDALYVVQEAERAGIAASMMVQEMAGPHGEDLGLVDFVPEADLLVSTGNRDASLTLPPIERVLGAPTLLDGRDASGELDVSMRMVCSSTTQVGANRTRGVAV